MKTHMSPEKGCLHTAVACVLNRTPAQIAEAINESSGREGTEVPNGAFHLDEVIRYLNRLHFPLLIEYNPVKGLNAQGIYAICGEEIVDTVPVYRQDPEELFNRFWLCANEGVVLTENHALAYSIYEENHEDEVWDPSGTWRKQTEIEPMLGLFW